MLYVGLTNLLFLLRYVIGKQGRRNKQTYLVVLFGLFIFSAFRYLVGCDWSGYYYQYEAAYDLEWSTLASMREPLWWALLAWINLGDFPYPVVNITSSAVFFVGIHIFARTQPDPLSFLVLLFPILIINMPMSGIRQGAAIGLICIALTSFTNRQPLRFAFWVLLAAGFHSSAIIFMLLLPLSAGRYTSVRLFVTVLLSLPGLYVLASTESAVIASSRYINTDIDAAGAAFRVSLLGLSALYYFLFVRNKWLITWPRDYFLISIGSIGMGLAVLLIPVSTVIADRLGYYLIPIQTMLFARLPFLPFQKNTAIHSAFPYLGLLFVFIVWSQASSIFEQCYIPYQTWIFGFPGGDPVGF